MDSSPVGARRWAADILTIGLHQLDRSSVVVRPVGEIDLVSTPTFRQSLGAQLHRCPRVLVELGGVTFLAIAGVRALEEATELAAARGTEIHLLCPANHTVTRLIRLMDPDARLTLRPFDAGEWVRRHSLARPKVPTRVPTPRAPTNPLGRSAGPDGQRSLLDGAS
ncbi:MAG TPA: STAS domain-containing protein [Pseudonocardia sp.]|jgi:anti-anti-sigma factor